MRRALRLCGAHERVERLYAHISAASKDHLLVENTRNLEAAVGAGLVPAPAWVADAGLSSYCH